MRAVEARLIYSSKTTGAFLVQEVWGIFDDLQPLFNRIFCKEIAQGPFGGCFVLFTKFFVELSTISTLSTYTCSNVGTWRTIHTVVFALIVTGPSSGRVFVRGGACFPPPPSLFRNNLCKDDSALFSRFLHAYSIVQFHAYGVMS